MLQFLIITVVLFASSWFSFVTDPSTAVRLQTMAQIEQVLQERDSVVVWR